ncbi:MAG: lipoate--protein ligase family protein [Nanobdellota archaeon]
MSDKAKNWRLVKSIETNGAMQMAIDEAILDARINNLVPNTLRFFTWKPKCLTIGYFQSLQKEVNMERAKDIDIVRRYTGGGATLHDKELTYSFAVHQRNVPGSIDDSYKIICNLIVKGLEELGLKAEFKEINDILVNGKKISGSAQTRKEGVILQHGTILLDVNLKEMFSYLKVSDEKIKDKMIKSAEERVTSLNEQLGRKISLEKAEKAMLKGFKSFSKFSQKELTDYELRLAKKFYKKYSSSEWRNLR